MRYIVSFLILGIFLFGCATAPTSTTTTTTTGNQTSTSGTPPGIIETANYQKCASQCTSGNAGSGAYCTDGCRLEEATRTKSTYWCDQLDNHDNIPSCYGTVAKTTGDLKLCDKFSGMDKSHCIAAFGSSSTG